MMQDLGTETVNTRNRYHILTPRFVFAFSLSGWFCWWLRGWFCWWLRGWHRWYLRSWGWWWCAQNTLACRTATTMMQDLGTETVNTRNRYHILTPRFVFAFSLSGWFCWWLRGWHRWWLRSWGWWWCAQNTLACRTATTMMQDL